MKSKKNFLWLIAILFMLAIWPIFTSNQFLLTMASMVLLSAIGAASLNLIIRTGHVSLAHAGFMGIGAYGCVLAQLYLEWSFPIALIFGCLLSGLVALAVGPIILRLTGKYFVLVTFMLGEIIRMIFIEWKSLTGGSNGLSNFPPIHPIFESSINFYYLALIVSVLCVALCWRILTSELGRAIDSMREAEKVALCSGVPVIKIKILIFVIGCVLVAIQGAFQAHLIKFVDPTSFNDLASLNFVVMNVIGGMFHVAGPLIGTIFISLFPELLRDYVDYQRVIFGVVLIIVMAALPGGIVGTFARLRGKK
jgi:branched-chain amino acid transport system permease protein